jgi:hypothetical protein
MGTEARRKDAEANQSEKAACNSICIFDSPSFVHVCVCVCFTALPWLLTSQRSQPPFLPLPSPTMDAGVGKHKCSKELIKGSFCLFWQTCSPACCFPFKISFFNDIEAHKTGNRNTSSSGPHHPVSSPPASSSSEAMPTREGAEHAQKEEDIIIKKTKKEERGKWAQKLKKAAPREKREGAEAKSTKKRNESIKNKNKRTKTERRVFGTFQLSIVLPNAIFFKENKTTLKTKVIAMRCGRLVCGGGGGLQRQGGHVL